MTLVHVSLLWGGVLVAAPFVIHLLMRRQPKRIEFPAIQFVAARVDSNRRTLRLRHWLLLALRAGALLLLALALARPTVQPARVGAGLSRALLANQESPVAVALVIDVACHMDYRHQNESRLDQARGLARWLLRQLPPESQAVVIDSHQAQTAFALDLAAAERSLEQLQISGVTRSMPELIAEALRVLQTSRQERREVYVISDLSRASWPEEARLASQDRAAANDTLLYVIDVGVPVPINASLGELRLSGERLPRGAPLRIECQLASSGMTGREVAVELHVDRPDVTRPVIVDGKPLYPETDRRGRAAYVLQADGTQPIQFELDGLPPGFHHGVVQLLAEDGLESDNRRYFSLLVQDAWRVLLAAGPDSVTSHALETLSPAAFRRSGQTRFDCRTISCSALPNENLEDFSVIALLDPEPLPAEIWERLLRYVQQGGSLAIFLGRNANPAITENPIAVQLLGGKLLRVWRAGGRELFLSPESYDHPLLAEFRNLATSLPWDDFPILRHWELGEFTPETRTVLHFNQGRPALLETSLGAGRVLTMTTPISEPAAVRGRTIWNELFASEAPLPAFLLVNEMFNYLVQRDAFRLNFQTGERITLPHDSQVEPERYQLFLPGELPIDVTAQDGRLALGAAEFPGTYYLKGGRERIMQRAASVNYPLVATMLERIGKEELDRILGPDTYRLARSQEEIKREIGVARVGRELYPYLLALLAGLLGIEFLLSNRFYRPVSDRLTRSASAPPESRRVA